MTLVGIDEAGYGPLLGPLVVSGVVFSVPDELAEANLWEVLSASISQTPARKDLRLPIADSKRLYNRKHGLTLLERCALVMMHVAGQRPRTLRALLEVLAPTALAHLDAYPWYWGHDPGLPLSTTAADVATRANAVRKDLAAAGVKLRGVFMEMLPEGHFNRQVLQTRNKATVLTGMALRIIHRAVQDGDGDLRVCVDRHGGRAYYAEKLMTFFDDPPLRIIEEAPHRSAYELRLGSRRCAIEFLTRGESHHLPIALASVYSKYLRELLMDGLNAYFGQRLKGLVPTAGYYQDARRFLADVEPIVQSEGLDRSMLVRSR